LKALPNVVGSSGFLLSSLKHTWLYDSCHVQIRFDGCIGFRPQQIEAGIFGCLTWD
jgi:hypothetical protein